ncbi:MAG: NDP-sugar synthase [Thermodesulfobacteria bacterium]|nr:NDP-sugar synthase [Thermodesulfobacteriota bacterium]
MQGFILAAGKGTRLRPYSFFLPKPLFPILGVPILEVLVRRLITLEIRKIGINLWYQKEKIKKFLVKLETKYDVNFWIFEEPVLLGTGGGILNAKSFFKKDSTLVINSDILTNTSLKNFLSFHYASNNPISMIFVKGKNDNVRIDTTQNKVLQFRTSGKSCFTYGGIQIIEPDAVKVFSECSDLIEIYQDLLKRGINIGAFLSKDYFRDIGTLNDYLASHQDILLKKVHLPGIPEVKNSIVIKNSTLKEVKVKEWAYIEGATIKNAILKRCVVWNGAKIARGSYDWCILT